jgi:hypothetical protein
LERPAQFHGRVTASIAPSNATKSQPQNEQECEG